jgi:putative drug exporter of the RND superfamily
VLMPAWMELLGDRSWYMPGWLRWVPDLRVEPSRPAAPEQRPYALR